MPEVNTLTRYYAVLDSGDTDAAVQLLAPDVAFAILLPGAVRRGSSRQDMTDYLAGRGPARRTHVPLRVTSDGDVDFVYGAVVEDGTTTTGHYLASCLVREDGLIATYEAAFDAELRLVPATDGR